MAKSKDVIRPTDDEAIRLAQTLIRTARYGALAVVDPADGWPLASRVGVATVVDGSPLILVSGLSAHTRSLNANPQCSLLLGEPAKGDPLAYPRVSLVCRASKLDRGSSAHREAGVRYIARHPKAKLYAGLGDFAYYRLDVVRAALNGGFGKAYNLSANDLRTTGPIALFASLQDESLARLASQQASRGGKRRRIVGVDPQGFDLLEGERASRIYFGEPATDMANAEHAARLALDAMT